MYVVYSSTLSPVQRVCIAWHVHLSMLRQSVYAPGLNTVTGIAWLHVQHTAAQRPQNTNTSSL